MSNLTVSAASARKAYHKGSADVKNVLEELFGEKAFEPKDIRDRIQCFDDVLAAAGDMSAVMMALLHYDGIDPDMLGARAMLKLTLIARVLNEGWTPDWTNRSEYKWWPWFKYESSGAGFGFSCTYYGYDHTYTFVSSRLCFKTEALAKHAGETFMKEYNEFLLISK